MASSTAVTDVMVEDGILIQILTFVEPSSTVGQQRITDDGVTTTIMQRKSQDDIINCTLVSKRFHNIISNHEENGTKKWNIIPVFEISPSGRVSRPSLRRWSSLRMSSLSRLFTKLRDMSLNGEIDNKQHFRHLTVNNIHEINNDISSVDAFEMFDRDGRSIELNGIRSIQIVPPLTPRGNTGHCSSIVCYLLNIAPNVRLLDLSGNNIRDFGWGLRNCLATNIETIRWDNSHVNSGMSLAGFEMSNQNNLKQIYMDESRFICNPCSSDKFANYEAEEDDVDNNNNNNNRQQQRRRRTIFIFHYCCEKLERVSIRNAQYVEHDPSADPSDEEPVIVKCVTQKALIKFVRNAPPTLQWFRSDLSPDNMEMLQQERYEIGQSKMELLN